MHPRQIAKRQGLSRYSGKPCPRGHNGTRLTVSGQCVVCHRANVKKYPPKGTRIRDAEQMREYKRKYYDRNAATVKARAVAWRKARPELNRHYSAAYRSRARQSIPPWADRAAILAFYKNTRAGFSVDHIIPLRGKFVSGLHTLENLQYLPLVANIRKGNRYGGKPTQTCNSDQILSL